MPITFYRYHELPTQLQPSCLEQFAAINLTWIEHYFVVEAKDRQTLLNPQQSILEQGGEVLFGLVNGDVAVTCALLECSSHSSLDSTPGSTSGNKIFELSKMGADTSYKGQGYSRLLVEYALQTARTLGATSVFLESNRRLTNALSIYSGCGFVEVPIADTPYARADIKMEIVFHE